MVKLKVKASASLSEVQPPEIEAPAASPPAKKKYVPLSAAALSQHVPEDSTSSSSGSSSGSDSDSDGDAKESRRKKSKKKTKKKEKEKPKKRGGVNDPVGADGLTMSERDAKETREVCEQLVFALGEEVVEISERQQERNAFARRLSQDIFSSSLDVHDNRLDWYGKHVPPPKNESVGVETGDLERWSNQKSPRILERRGSHLRLSNNDGVLRDIEISLAECPPESLRVLVLQFAAGLDVGDQLDLRDMLFESQNAEFNPSPSPSKRREPPSPIQLLDNRLLLKIFMMLPLPNSLSALSLTCKKFRIVAKYPELYQRLNLARLPHPFTQQSVLTVVSRHPLSEEIVYPRLNGAASVEIFSKTLRLAKELRRLDMSACKDMDDDWVAALRYAPHLEQLNLGGCMGVTSQGLETLARNGVPPRLDTLDLSGCSNITDTGAVAIASACPQLRTLKLNNCQLLTDATLMALAQSGARLTELDLSLCVNITDEGIFALRALPSLLKLSLYYCTRLTSAGIKALGCLPRLRSVDLTYCDNVSDTAVWTLAEKCYLIEQLDLYGCSSVGDVSMSACGEYLTRLKRLNLGFCSHVTDFGLESLANGECSQTLTHLDLTSCVKVTHVGVCDIAQRCASLVHLDLTGCRLVNDECLVALGRHCPTLKYLSISGCKGVSDYGILEFAALTVGVNLSVNVAGGPLFSSKAKATLKEQYPHITLKK